jgi:alpha-aminoadipic semialdehyde synthase
MEHVIGIRREDKNEWERRAPLTPEHVRWLKETHGVHTIVQPSPIRVFSDDEYRAAGATISEDLSRARVVFAVKEIPAELFQPDTAYVFFSHTIKGQPYNMDMLRRMMEVGAHLIDYERFLDDNGRRLIFFGRYAGLAGMVETLHAYGRKLSLQGYDTPLARILPAWKYASLDEARTAVKAVGDEIDANGLPMEIVPQIVGFSGYGNVSRGAQEIFDLLPHKVISAGILDVMYENFTDDNFNFYKVVFHEDDMVRRKSDGGFELQEYYNHPDRYESIFNRYLPRLNVLVNCIYWTEDYPRLVTRDFLRNAAALRSNPTLQVIGDISCDIEGSIEICREATMPDAPCYTYMPAEDRFEDGVQRLGVTVMAVDNLPCEFPGEASRDFSDVLKEYVMPILKNDFSRSTDEMGLDPVVRRALILHGGRLTEPYGYMQDFLS